MKNLWFKFAAVFLWWIGFSMLMTTLANNISVSTDFNTATQYLKKIIVTDFLNNDKIILDGNSNDVLEINGNIQTDWNIFSQNFCDYGATDLTTECIKANDIRHKFSSLEESITTKTITLTNHFDYNYLSDDWMTCDIDHEWEIIYAYSDDNQKDWNLYVCKVIPTSPDYEHREYQRKKILIN